MTPKILLDLFYSDKDVLGGEHFHLHVSKPSAGHIFEIDFDSI